MSTEGDTRVLMYIWQSQQPDGNPSEALVLALDEEGQAHLACSRRSDGDALSRWSHRLMVSAEQADAILLALAAALPWALPASDAPSTESAQEWCQLETPSGGMHFCADHPAGLALCRAIGALIPSAVWQELGLPRS